MAPTTKSDLSDTVADNGKLKNEESSADEQSNKITFTLIKSTNPDRLTKVLSLDDEGKLHKQVAAHMSSGFAQTVTVTGLKELQTSLNFLDSSMAVAWGTMNQESAAICTSTDAPAQQKGALARTRSNFSFKPMPGIMMLDHDGKPYASLLRDDFRNLLLTAAPVIQEAPMLWRPSASAGCIRPDDTALTPLDRHRLYIPVVDASLIPLTGKALADLLWAHGEGWYEVGNAGQALERCLVDTSVWQPERLDFAGPPVLESGITRPGCEGVIYGREDHLFDLNKLIAACTDDVKAAAEIARKKAKAGIQAQCQVQAAVWAAEKAPALAKRRGISESNALDLLQRASQGNVLAPDFELITSTGQTVTVGDLLQHPEKWHRQVFADPLDPDHDMRVAIAYLDGNNPIIYSQRHGGVTYRLGIARPRVEIGRGKRIASTDATIEVLAKGDDLFDYGDRALAFVSNGKASAASKEWLLDHMGRNIDYYSVKATKDTEGKPKFREIPEDAPLQIATAIMAKYDSRGFRKLTGVCTSPILRLDGSIIDQPGYDAASGLLYCALDSLVPELPEQPSMEAAQDALAELWRPFSQFPLVDDVSRGVLLSAALSVMLRPVLPTCPAFGFDAPAAGTGKTLLAKAIGAISNGEDAPVLTPAKDEDECRKRLFASLRNGEKVLLWDNVRDPFGNAAIDTFLTSPTFADRVLGVSETEALPNKALFLITGNNLVLTGDTHRRVLKMRLDAQVEQPFTRQFDFDPVTMVIKNRLKLVVAGLTIVRAYITAGMPKSGGGSVASFEHWDRLVRQPLCWLMQIVQASGRKDLPSFEDPRLAVTSAESENPEQSKLAAILDAWNAVFGNAPAAVAAAITEGVSLGKTELFDAMDEIAGQNGKINSRMLGRWIERHAEQRKDGMRFVRAGKANGVVRWQVVKA